MGIWFAICCTSKASTSVVISHLKEEYTDPSEPPTEQFDPPFKDQDVKTCWQTPSTMIDETESNLDATMFAVLDDMSVEDESALLVLVLQDDEDGDAEIETVRVGFDRVSDTLLVE